MDLLQTFDKIGYEALVDLARTLLQLAQNMEAVVDEIHRIRATSDVLVLELATIVLSPLETMALLTNRAPKICSRAGHLVDESNVLGIVRSDDTTVWLHVHRTALCRIGRN